MRTTLPRSVRHVPTTAQTALPYPILRRGKTPTGHCLIVSIISVQIARTYVGPLSPTGVAKVARPLTGHCRIWAAQPY